MMVPFMARKTDVILIIACSNNLILPCILGIKNNEGPCGGQAHLTCFGAKFYMQAFETL